MFIDLSIDRLIALVGNCHYINDFSKPVQLMLAFHRHGVVYMSYEHLQLDNIVYHENQSVSKD
jgi:hypothetical protein